MPDPMAELKLTWVSWVLSGYYECMQCMYIYIYTHTHTIHVYIYIIPKRQKPTLKPDPSPAVLGLGLDEMGSSRDRCCA